MSIPGNTLNFGGGPGGATRFSQTRGRMGNGMANGVNYPSPFFDIAHTYLPTTVKSMFRWCRYYFLTNPIINATVFKLSEYPITEIEIDHPDKKVATKWKEYFEDHLNYRAFQIECGLDYNCFHGDVKAVTEGGVYKLRDLVGKDLRVLSQDGVYRPAKFVESITHQELLEVEFFDGSTVLATREHLWPTLTSAGNVKKVATTELEGRFVPRNVAPRPEQNADFFEGVRHGFVFGDGTLYNDGKQARAIFCGEKDKAMLKYFEGHGSPPYVEARGHIYQHGMPPHYKALPKNEESASYWYGFLCGFLAADGSVDVAGCVVLTQRSKATLEAIAVQLPRLGMIAGNVRGYEEITAYGEGTTYMLSLFKQYMLPQDFLLSHHASNFTDNYKPTNYGKKLQVKSVNTTGIFEKVFCCMEEETNTFTIDNGILTGNTYGNCLTSLSYPFQKHLTCARCGFSAEAKRIRPHWVHTNYEFRMSCPKCAHLGTATAKDKYFPNENGVRVMRWSPEDVEISYSDLTGEYTYFYNIPPGVRNDVIVGKKDAVEQVPEVFMQALRQQKGVVFNSDLFFHLKRPTLAGQDRGWGIPLMLPCLKDTFYLQIMKKAQEAILLEHIVPLRILFPQAGSGTSDPYCVSPETLVETPSGLVRADAVGEGSYLRSHTGAWRRVDALRARPVKAGEKVFKFKVASLPAFPFVVSEEHPILAVLRVHSKQPREGLVDPAFIPAEHLKKGDYVAYPVKRTVRKGEMLDLAEHTERAATKDWVYRRLNQGAAEIYEWLENNEDPKHAWGERKALLDANGWLDADYATAYSMRTDGARVASGGIDRVARYIPMSPGLAELIGYYLAEGCSKSGLASFSLHLNEKNIAESIEYITKGLGFRGVSHHERPEQNGRSATIEDVLLSDLLFSMCGKGFADKRMPAEVSEGSNNIVVAALRALFAGDGCDFQTSTNRVALKLANASLVMEARRLLLSFGLIGGVLREEPTAVSISKATAYHLNFNGVAADQLRVLFAGGSLNNGMEAQGTQRSGLIRGDYVLLRIDEIEEVTDVPTVIGFQMQGDKSFCVAGVATHNTTINLVDWRDHVATEIARWRYDPNYIPILPLPVGNQTIGGDGRALLMVNEMQQMSEQLINGMQVPLEFIKGGLSYAGTNISMRMLENQFIVYLSRHTRMAKWVMRSVADYLKWPMANIRFKPFKMADDIQRKAFLFQLNQAGKVSDTTLLMDSDLDQEQEDQIMERETAARMAATKKQQLAQAELQGEQQVIMMKITAKAQQELAAASAAPTAPGEPGGPEAATGGTPPGGQGGAAAPPMLADPMSQMSSPLNLGQNMGMGTSPPGAGGPAPTQAGQQASLGGSNILSMAQSLAMQLSALDPAQQHLAIKNLRTQSPELADLVLQMLATTPNASQQQQQGQPGQAPGQPGLGANGAAAVSVDMRPMPQQRAPRRAAKSV